MMKKLTIFLMLFSLISLFAGPSIVGNMTNPEWSPADPDYDLTENANGVWELTKTMAAGNYVYKAVNGDTWEDPNFPNDNLSLDLAEETEITWRVNFDNQYVTHYNPVVVGDFFSEIGGTNWSPDDLTGEMFDTEGDDVFIWQGLIPEGSWEAKVALNRNWEQNTGANIPFLSDGVTETVITYNMANNQTTVEAPPPPSALITFIVDDSGAQTHTGFYLKGSWNDEGYYDPTWNGGAVHTQFYDDGTNGDEIAGDNIWTVQLELVSDGGANNWQWGVEDTSNQWLDGNFPFQVIDDSPQTLTYLVPGGTTQEVTVTFQVDMSVQIDVTSVYLAGTFTGWGDAPIEMVINSRGVYTTDVLFPAGTFHTQSFKYIKNGTDWEYIDDRELIINDESSTQILDVVYFNNEEPQEGTTQDVTVTFQIYMGGLDLGWYINGVSIQGNVSPLDWTDGSNELTEVEGVYTADVLFPAGSLYGVEYKFARLDGDLIWNFETFDGNRYFEIDDSGAVQVLGIHYWNNVIPEPEVTITMNGNNAELSWEAIPGVTGYNIFRDVDAYGTFENKLNLLPWVNTTYTDENVQETKYFYRVIAIQN